MSGHSKWATTKYRKGAQDKARAKVFAKLIRQVEVAAREGGGDLNANAVAADHVPEGPGRLGADGHHRAGHQAGHAASSRGSATRPSTTRATRPGGVAVIVETLTDNRNRTGSEVRNLFSTATAARWPSPAP